MTAIIIMAKNPVPGRVKTRLAPPLAAVQAADVAAAAIWDTVVAARSFTAEVLVAWEDGGHADVPAISGLPWAGGGVGSSPAASQGAPTGSPTARSSNVTNAAEPVRRIPQVGASLGERLDHAIATGFAIHPGPQVVIGMDTPQVGPEDLHAVAQLAGEPGESGIGLAVDGGFWALALGSAPAAFLAEVPMSQSDTGQRTVQHLCELGFRVRWGPRLEDVDDAGSAQRVAALAPQTRFAARYLTMAEEPDSEGRRS